MQLSFIFTAIWLFIITTVLAKADYYQILGVEKDASEKQIKSAYRQLTLKYHPDKNPGNDKAHDKFIEIGEAYEVLSNPEKRRNYDQYGDPEGRPQPGGGGDFGDMFAQFFDGGGQGRRQQQPGQRKGELIRAALDVALKDFYNGKIVEFDVMMMNDCESCKGTGSEDNQKHTCPKCKGQGEILIQHQIAPNMISQTRQVCPQCRGKGKVITHPCKQCQGQGVVRGPRHYDIYIKPGQPRDSAHVLEGEGDKNPNWIPGDLIILFQEKLDESWGYRRVGNNLYRTEAISLNESLYGGWERQIKFLDVEDDIIKLSRGAGVPVADGEVEVLVGKGMPILVDHDEEEQFGDLFIEYKVVIPGGSPNKQQPKAKAFVAGGVKKDEF